MSDERRECIDNIDCRSLQCLRGCRRAADALSQETQEMDRRERYAAAISESRRNGLGGLTEAEACNLMADAAIAVADEEHAERMKHTVQRLTEVQELRAHLEAENVRLRAELDKWFQHSETLTRIAEGHVATIQRVRAVTDAIDDEMSTEPDTQRAALDGAS
ncbi:hypothetical protein [Streptomyces lydicus]|uniref:hypothetical protein n=1 Tax=Streptomyces lydicus TaxID=47763 RepID=UPI0037AC4033